MKGAKHRDHCGVGDGKGKRRNDFIPAIVRPQENYGPLDDIKIELVGIWK